MDKKTQPSQRKGRQAVAFPRRLDRKKIRKVNEGMDDLGKRPPSAKRIQSPVGPIGGIHRSQENVQQVETQSTYTEVLNLVKATHHDASRYQEKNGEGGDSCGCD